MQFHERLEKSKILVIGASYTEEDFLSKYGNQEGWFLKDEYYIGIGKTYVENDTLVEFEDQNPLDTDWNDPNFLQILKKTLKNKKFEEIWVDRGTIHHFLREPKNSACLKYLIEEHTALNSNFFMLIDSCDLMSFVPDSSTTNYHINGDHIEINGNRHKIKGITSSEVKAFRERYPKANAMFYYSNPLHQVVTDLLGPTLKINKEILEFRECKFNTFKINHQLLNKYATASNSSNNQLLLFSDEKIAKQLQEECDFAMAKELAEEDLNLSAIETAFQALNP